MPEIVYVTLRYVFLGLLYAFLALVARLIYRELKPAPAKDAVRAAARPRKTGHRARLVLVGETPFRRQGNWEVREETVIGRAPECAVCVEDEFASNQHARVYRTGEGYFVEDLGSTNGTYVNGRRINYPIGLRYGDRIRVGRTVLEFRR
ncbi:MAG: FHA domain-containing protein [Actinomycetota bacterium]|nr:FHA domain-containing protein [Actinomycetota bacterium]